ncbi:MAG: alpha/beta hydrolase [Betaproteobacteria bacterium]
MLRRALMCYLAFAVGLCPCVIAATRELPPDVKTLEVNGYEMAFVERGTGVPVVLVHGTVSDYRWWAPQMAPFGEGFRTIAVSLRHFYPERWNGQGEDASVRQHADDLAAFITGLHAGPVHVVGHSRGGDVVLLMASTHPELLLSVVLVDPAPLEALLPKTPPSSRGGGEAQQVCQRRVETFTARRYRGWLGKLYRWSDWPRGMAKDAGPAKTDNARQRVVDQESVNGLQRTLHVREAANITVPVLMVTGETSPRPYDVMMEALAPCLKQLEKITIPNAAHAMNRTNPQAFNAAVLEFLAMH